MKIGLKNNVLRVTHKRKRVESYIDSELEEAALCLVRTLEGEPGIHLLTEPLECLRDISIYPPTKVGNKYITVVLDYSGDEGTTHSVIPIDVTGKSWKEIIDYNCQLIRVVHILGDLIHKLKNKLNNEHV